MGEWAWGEDEDGVVTLMIRREVVLGVMPKRRKDSAIYWGLSIR